MATSVKMSPEEIERSVSRLSKRNPREVKLKPLVQHRSLTQEQREGSTKRLYDDSIAHRERRLQEIEESANAEINRYNEKATKLDESEQEEMVRRLYNESIETKENNLKAMYEREVSLDVRTTKKLGKSQQSAAVDRLYREGMEHNRKKHIALFEEFVLSRQPHAVKRTPAQLEMSSEKMTKGEGLSFA